MCEAIGEVGLKIAAAIIVVVKIVVIAVVVAAAVVEEGVGAKGERIKADEKILAVGDTDHRSAPHTVAMQICGCCCSPICNRNNTIRCSFIMTTNIYCICTLSRGLVETKTILYDNVWGRFLS